MFAAFVTRVMASSVTDKTTNIMANRATQMATHTVKELGTGYTQAKMEGVVKQAMKDGLHKLSAEQQNDNPRIQGMVRAASFVASPQAAAAYGTISKSASFPMLTSLANPTKPK